MFPSEGIKKIRQSPWLSRKTGATCSTNDDTHFPGHVHSLQAKSLLFLGRQNLRDVNPCGEASYDKWLVMTPNVHDTAKLLARGQRHVRNGHCAGGEPIPLRHQLNDGFGKLFLGRESSTGVIEMTGDAARFVAPSSGSFDSRPLWHRDAKGVGSRRRSLSLEYIRHFLAATIPKRVEDSRPRPGPT